MEFPVALQNILQINAVILKSMTGFGKAESAFQNKKFTIEIKSLNSKQIDISLRIPNCLREYEPEIRNRVTQAVKRGKTDLFVTIESSDEYRPVQIQTELIKNYCDRLISIHQSFGMPIPDNLILSTLRLPDVVKSDRQEVCPEEWSVISSMLGDALQSLDRYRVDEGLILMKDLLSRVQTIEQLLELVPPLESRRIDNFKTRLKKHLEEASRDNLIDNNRLEQEIIYYIEKFDITEEKVRLVNHCRYFKETAEQSEDSGRKLGFIAQEMGREINTLGSKANDSDIQKIVVMMKDELEKIKEQVLNIL